MGFGDLPAGDDRLLLCLTPQQHGTAAFLLYAGGELHRRVREREL